MSWIYYALLGAVATAITAVLTKAGLQKVDSTVGFGVQSVVIVVLSWLILNVQGRATQILDIPGKAWILLLCSGVSTTVAYLFYFKALSLGDASRVAPVDRLSLVFSILFAALILREKVTTPVLIGAALMTSGAILIAIAPSR